MKKRLIALCLLAALSLTLFAACGKTNKTVSVEDAKKIALEEIGKTANEVDDIHTHTATYEDTPCYQFHITAGDQTYYVYIDQAGNVLHTE